MNYTFNKTFNSGFNNYGGKFKFSSKFYKNCFKNKSIFNAFNSSANKCQAILTNLSNKLFIDRAAFLANNQCSAVNTLKAGSGEGILSGESRVATIGLKLNQEILNRIFGFSLDKMFSLFCLAKYGILILI